MRAPIFLILLLGGVAACAPLANLPAALQPPTVALAEDRPAELRLLGPAADRPFGGAALRLHARVGNPNPLGITLTRVDGSLFLENQRAALVDLPLGLPLPARQDTVIPFDLLISFADAPQLATALARVANRAEAQLRLDGTVGVNAGLLGMQSFGPATLLEGTVPIVR